MRACGAFWGLAAALGRGGAARAPAGRFAALAGRFGAIGGARRCAAVARGLIVVAKGRRTDESDPVAVRVRFLAGVGVPHERICEAIDISKPTLQSRFAWELRTGPAFVLT